MICQWLCLPLHLLLKGSSDGPPWMVIFLEPPVQLMLACFKSEPTELVSMEVTVTVLDGPPADGDSSQLALLYFPVFIVLIKCDSTRQA